MNELTVVDSFLFLILIVLFRFSDFVDPNAGTHSKRRRTHVRPNGPKPSVNQPEKNWLLIHHLNLRGGDMFLLNTTETCGRNRWRP